MSINVEVEMIASSAIVKKNFLERQASRRSLAYFKLMGSVERY